MYWRASSREPLPSALPIRAVVPVEIPMPMARRMKNTGKESDMAARAVVESRPPYQISTTLNMVLKKKPVPAGIARRRIKVPMGAVVRSELI